ncbi:MAG: ribose-phosphate pyrophosphokinase [Oscillospiraceae bacterium]|jgi:ribose-phosphate pyrophosphokinase|nr:ribose-phosphate pyrophosphokinase [Oscillospiraceae bacterium]
MPEYEDLFATSMPLGQVGLIALPGCEALAAKINYYLADWRHERNPEHKNTLNFVGYERSTYLVKAAFPRFATGEGKCVIEQSVRGFDIYLLCDVFNYGVTFDNFYGMKNVPMCPDAHFANLKRAISAIAGKARRVSVIMPMLYEGRQHKRSMRESMDCAQALQELTAMGVENIITFDAHDSRVQNAVPLSGFENVRSTYQMIKALHRAEPNLIIDKEHLIVISPDEGGMNRCIYYATVLGVELGMFYKRRDYTRLVNGRNPIIAHEFLGASLEGKDVIVVDDMISSGESILEVACKLKEMNAGRIFVCAAFGLFNDGLDRFDRAFEEGLFSRIFTTNTVYRSPELLQREWYTEVDLSKYISYIIDNLNHDLSISRLLNPADKIKAILMHHRLSQEERKAQ